MKIAVLNCKRNNVPDVKNADLQTSRSAYNIVFDNDNDGYLSTDSGIYFDADADDGEQGLLIAKASSSKSPSLRALPAPDTKPAKPILCTDNKYKSSQVPPGSMHKLLSDKPFAITDKKGKTCWDWKQC